MSPYEKLLKDEEVLKELEKIREFAKTKSALNFNAESKYISADEKRALFLCNNNILTSAFLYLYTYYEANYYMKYTLDEDEPITFIKKLDATPKEYIFRILRDFIDPNNENYIMIRADKLFSFIDEFYSQENFIELLNVLEAVDARVLLEIKK